MGRDMTDLTVFFIFLEVLQRSPPPHLTIILFSGIYRSNCLVPRRTNLHIRDPLIGSLIGGKYRLERLLGHGGVAAVYRARHLVLDRLVVVKLLAPYRRGETQHYDWFVREARAVNRARHPNIIDIYDIGVSDTGLYYLVMEYFEGDSVEYLLLQEKVLPVTFATSIIREVALALACAHHHGIVHRDVKTGNILVNQNCLATHNLVRLIDFGLASMTGEPRLAEAHDVFGTLEYMSPEQTRGSLLDPPSDMYSLGIVYYEMVTGRLPFIAHDRRDLLGMHCLNEPRAPSMIDPAIPHRVSDIIMWMLRKTREDRLPSMDQLISELNGISTATT